MDYSSNVPGQLTTVGDKRKAFETILEGESLSPEVKALLKSMKEFTVRKGMRYDARNHCGKWEEAEIIEIGKDSVTVEYVHYDYHDTVPLGADRLARHRTQSNRKVISRYNRDKTNKLTLEKFTN